MSEPRRPKLTALGVLIWRDHLLVMPSYIPGDPPAWRPLGGNIEFGERARDAVVRELLEETGRRVQVVEEMSIVETVREHRGEVGHEISFPFIVRWATGEEPADLTPIACEEADGATFEARWMHIAEVIGGSEVIHPPGLAKALAGWLPVSGRASEA